MLSRINDVHKSAKQIHILCKSASITVTLFVLEIFVQCDFTVIALLEACGISIESAAVKVIADILTQAIWFTGLFFVVDLIFAKIARLLWLKFHPEKNIEGQWLHIHDKEDVKIGLVTIKQDFYDLTVNAFNIKPCVAEYKKTKWSYIGSAFSPFENVNIRLMGCYFAQRTDEPDKQGVHLFREFEYENGKIVKMKGEFGDALRETPEGRFQDATDKTGRIILYKLSKKMKGYLFPKKSKEISETTLCNILNCEDEQIIREPFVMDLKKIFYKNSIQKNWFKLTKTDPNPVLKDAEIISEAERVLITVLVYLAFADGNIDGNELQSLASITGFHLTRAQACRYRITDGNKVITGVKEFINRLGDNPYAIDLYTDILRESAELISVCDKKLDTAENGFLNSLKAEIGKKKDIVLSPN